MRLVVTRPEPDATALKAQLTAQGHEVLVEPLLTISFADADPIEPHDAQALIATSRNGVRALAQSTDADAARELPLYAVGPGTAAAAKALGFNTVIAGPGTAGELIALIADSADVNGGPLVHLAGDRLAVDLAGELRRLGFHVHAPVVYATVAADAFTAGLVRRLAAGEIDAVLLLSPRTAAVYARLIQKHHLEGRDKALLHICLSPAVARALAPLDAIRTVVAAAPNLKELLALTARSDPQSA